MTYSGVMSCTRCGKNIPHPDSSNADYIIASDTIVREPTEVLIALKHNQETLAKNAKNEVISDNEYIKVEVPDIKTAQRNIGEDLVKVVAEVKDKDIQKTGVICPDCYKPTDTVIWGVHKGG